MLISTLFAASLIQHCCTGAGRKFIIDNLDFFVDSFLLFYASDPIIKSWLPLAAALCIFFAINTSARL